MGRLRALKAHGPHIALAALVGAGAGGVAIAFQYALVWSESLRNNLLDAMHGHPTFGWAVLPFLGLVAGCLTGLGVAKLAPDAPGSGIPHIKAVLLRLRELRWKTLLPVKFIGGVLGIGAGLSLGREGPTVQMGASVGAAVADMARIPRKSASQLISCGAGAGLAAAFNAPLAGVTFVIEELQREFSSLTLGSALVAAVTATVVTQSVTGMVPAFTIKGYPALPLTALWAAAVLGVVAGAVGVLFNRCLLAALKQAHAIKRIPAWTLPGIVCAAMGLAGWWIPDAIGGGHSVAQRLLSGQMGATIGTLALLAIAKLLTTVFSYASGAPGGIFAPMLLIGALCGTIFAKVCVIAFPSLSDHEQALAVLGMAAFFTASVRAPLTGIVLILEMTANYDQLFALCIACLGAYLFAEAVEDRPIYEALFDYDLHRRGHGAGSAEPVRVFISVHHGSRMDGRRITEVGMPRGCLVVAVERVGRELLPAAELVLRAGDHITVLTPPESPEHALTVVRLATDE